MAPSTPEQAPESLYPNIEGFIEVASPEEIAALFSSLKESLAGLKGPRAEQGKKVQKAIERTEELLTFLLQIREKIEEDRKSGGRGKR